MLQSDTAGLSPSFEGRLVAVIDDDPLVLDSMGGLLRSWGCTVVTTASPQAPIERANMAAARAAGLTAQMLKVSGPKPDLEGAFKAMADEKAEALVVLEVPSVFNIAKSVAEMATARRLPTMVWGGQVDAGALMGYGTSFLAVYPRIPAYVDRVLKGAKPADTAIEVVSKRQLVINLKTARELGVAVPAELLKRADRVIE